MHTKQTVYNISCFVEDVARGFLYEFPMNENQVRNCFTENVGFSADLLTSTEKQLVVADISSYINNNQTITYCHEKANATISAVLGHELITSTNTVSIPIGV